MSNMAGALPDFQNRGGPQSLHHQESQRYSGGIGGPAQYGSQQLRGQLPFNTGNYPMHPSQYAGSYQEAAAAAQIYGQMQAAQRMYSGGSNSVQSSYPGAPYLQTSQQQYMYYPGQYGQPGQAGQASSDQGFGQYGADLGGRKFHSGYPMGPNQSGQYLRPGLASKSISSLFVDIG